MKAQTTSIKRHLEKGHGITALGALKKFGCLRLAARIRDLREDGCDIEARPIKVGTKRVTSYRLARG